jgi:hypothetical protein
MQKKYGLQECLGDLVLLFHDCCEFGLPVPLYFALWNISGQAIAQGDNR